MNVESYWEIRPYKDHPDEGRLMLWTEVNGRRVGPEAVVASGKISDLNDFIDGVVSWRELGQRIMNNSRR